MHVGHKLARAALVAFLLLLIGAPSGCVGCGGEPESRDAGLLRLRFPEQAKQVLEGSAAFAEQLDGFSLDLPTAEPPAEHRGLQAKLPRMGGDAVKFELPG